jgi:Flp pilus assembly protein TadD
LARISNNIGHCFSQEGLFSDAEKWLKQSLGFDRASSVVPTNNLAQIYLGQDRPKSALQVLEQAQAYFPNDTRRRLLTEASLIRLDRTDDAITELQSLLNSDNPPVEAYIDLGWILVDLRNDNENAIAVLRSGFARYPKNSLLANNLAYAYLMRGEPQYARSILDSFSADNDHVHLIATRGLLRLWEGDFIDADAFYKQAEQLASQWGASDLARLVRQKKYLEFARAHLRLGQRAEARENILAGLSVPKARQPYKYQKDLEELKVYLELPNG